MTTQATELHHPATIAFLASGGRVSTASPDSLRRELTRLGLPFSTSDEGGATGTTFKLIRLGPIDGEQRMAGSSGSLARPSHGHR